MSTPYVEKQRNLAESSRELRREVANTAADAIAALDRGKPEQARDLMVALLAADKAHRGPYAAELSLRQAARDRER